MEKINSSFLVIIPVILCVIAACHHSPENKAFKGIKKLPHFTFLSVDSSHIINSEDIPPGRPCVFFYFDPNCEHCQKETGNIKKYQRELKNARFYFLSDSDPKDIDSFSRYYRLDSLSNVFVGIDFKFTFFDAFLPSAVPYLAVYDSHKMLAKVYNGEADIKSLISQIGK